jgi:hypothetical protein
MTLDLQALRLTQDEITEAERRATFVLVEDAAASDGARRLARYVRSMATELRQLHVTDRDREVLRIVQDDVREFGLATDGARGLWQEAVEVLGRLIGAES